MAIAFGVHVGNATDSGIGGPPGTLALTGTPSAGSLVLLQYANHAGDYPLTGVTDTKGNTWFRCFTTNGTRTSSNAVVNPTVELWVSLLTTTLTATVDTITVTGGNPLWAITLDSFTGLLANAARSRYGAAVANNNNGLSNGDPAPVSTTVVNNGDLIIGTVADSSNNNPWTVTGWTPLAALAYAGGTNSVTIRSFWILSSSTAVTTFAPNSGVNGLPESAGIVAFPAVGDAAIKSWNQSVPKMNVR